MQTVKLSLLKTKDSGRILDVSGCSSAKKRLYELGLVKGTNVKMVKNDFGPVILCISGHKLALGRGLAEKITVEC